MKMYKQGNPTWEQHCDQLMELLTTDILADSLPAYPRPWFDSGTDKTKKRSERCNAQRS